jgi:plasmid stabilization system protein ParE
VRQRLLFRPEARGDISRAAHRYEEERPGLGERFVAELGEFLDRIAASPAQFPLVEEGVRRCALRRFPYAIYFSVEESGTVVMAVVHRRRNPDVWKRRI